MHDVRLFCTIVTLFRKGRAKGNAASSVASAPIDCEEEAIAAVLAIAGVKGASKTPAEMDAILAERKKAWRPKPPRYTKGILKIYSEHTPP